MTNEEKARELQLDYTRGDYGDSTDIRGACEEMAEWKDKQFKEYLEKKKKDIMNNPYTGHCLSDMNLLEEIINELFNEK